MLPTVPKEESSEFARCRGSRAPPSLRLLELLLLLLLLVRLLLLLLPLRLPCGGPAAAAAVAPRKSGSLARQNRVQANHATKPTSTTHAMDILRTKSRFAWSL